MPLLTLLDHALLGLLSLAPMSGYDIHKVFASTPLAHFSSSPGAIYPALKRLERSGLISAQLDTTRQTRPRRIYTLTATGAEELDAWLRQPVTREELIRSAGEPVLRFTFMEGRLRREEIVAYLVGYRAAVTAYVAQLEGFREAVKGGGVHAALSLEHGLQGYRAEQKWTEEAIEAIRTAISADQRSDRGGER